MASTAENEALFRTVCKLAYDRHKCYEDEDGQRLRSPTPEHCLNRLFKKHLKRWQRDLAEGALELTKDNVSVTLKEWKKVELIALPHETTAQEPGGELSDPPDPVIVVRYRGRDCLIDGRRRINLWQREGKTGTYPTYVLATVI